MNFNIHQFLFLRTLNNALIKIALKNIGKYCYNIELHKYIIPQIKPKNKDKITLNVLYTLFYDREKMYITKNRATIARFLTSIYPPKADKLYL